MKRTFYLAAAALAIALIAPAANSQQRDLDLRFHVPFQFSIGNKTFAAGDYQITYQSSFMLNVYNREDHTSAFERVGPSQMHTEADGRVRLVFHRFDNEYFLAFVSNGSSKATYDFQISKQETQLTNASPRKPVTIVSVTPNKNSEVFSNRTGHLQ